MVFNKLSVSLFPLNKKNLSYTQIKYHTDIFKTKHILGMYFNCHNTKNKKVLENYGSRYFALLEKCLWGVFDLINLDLVELKS